MSLSPLAGSFVALYYARSDNAISSEPMQEVDLTALGIPAHSVYEIIDPTKRYLNDNVAPVFKVNGSVVAPSSIEYVGGRIYLATPAANPYTVICYSGNYLTVTQFIGASAHKFNDLCKTQDVTCYGDTAIQRFPVEDDWNMTTDVFYAKMKAFYLSTGGNANSHILFEDQAGGTAGNDKTIAIVDPGAPGSLSVAVSGSDVTVTAAYAAGAITSTANDVAKAINEYAACKALKFQAFIPQTESGKGIVAALGSPHQHLAGGLDEQDFATIKDAHTKLVTIIYAPLASDIRWEGFAYISQIAMTGKPGEVVKGALTLEGGKYPLYYRGG
jgi:hypothetical protein